MAGRRSRVLRHRGRPVGPGRGSAGRAARRIEAETASSSHGRDATELARAAFDKDLHTALLYSC